MKWKELIQLARRRAGASSSDLLPDTVMRNPRQPIWGRI